MNYLMMWAFVGPLVAAVVTYHLTFRFFRWALLDLIREASTDRDVADRVAGKMLRSTGWDPGPVIDHLSEIRAAAWSIEDRLVHVLRRHDGEKVEDDDV